MRFTIDGYPATLHVPDGTHVVDVVLVARVVAKDNPQQDSVIVGGTDHTGSLVRDLILEHGQFIAMDCDADIEDK